MKRREFMTLIGGTAAMWPLATGAQQASKIAKVGVLYPGTAATLSSRLAGLREGLQAAGHLKPSAQCSRMRMITSGSLREPKNAQQAAGHSQSSYSIR